MNLVLEGLIYAGHSDATGFKSGSNARRPESLMRNQQLYSISRRGPWEPSKSSRGGVKLTNPGSSRHSLSTMID
jgi:hypothetical protein